MKNYYYLMASVPSLDLKMTPSLSSESFLKTALEQLSQEHGEQLCQILSDEPLCSADCEINQYLQWDKAVRNALVKLRAPAGDNGEECREGELIPAASTLAAALFKIESPLKAEQTWDGERWQFLENLKTGHYFDFEAVAIYALQLRLAERQSRFQEKVGEEQYSALYKAVIENESRVGV